MFADYSVECANQVTRAPEVGDLKCYAKFLRGCRQLCEAYLGRDLPNYPTRESLGTISFNKVRYLPQSSLLASALNPVTLPPG